MRRDRQSTVPEALPQERVHDQQVITSDELVCPARVEGVVFLAFPDVEQRRVGLLIRFVSLVSTPDGKNRRAVEMLGGKIRLDSLIVPEG